MLKTATAEKILPSSHPAVVTVQNSEEIVLSNSSFNPYVVPKSHIPIVRNGSNVGSM